MQQNPSNYVPRGNGSPPAPLPAAQPPSSGGVEPMRDSKNRALRIAIGILLMTPLLAVVLPILIMDVAANPTVYIAIGLILLFAAGLILVGS